jgi:hypothetical protein
LEVEADLWQVGSRGDAQMMRSRLLRLFVLVVFALAPVLAFSGPSQASVTPAVGPSNLAVGIAATHSGHGYWIATAAGNVYPFGDARSYGSLSGVRLNAPVVGIAATVDGGGYWLVAKDGGVFSFGDAHFYGSTGNIKLNAPVVGMAPTGDGDGYWLAAADGGVFSFGDAAFSGSHGADPPASRIVGISAFPDDSHYWLLTASGEMDVFGFPSGSWPAGWADISPTPPNAPFVAVANWGTRSDFGGIWMVGADGGVFTLGGAGFYGSTGATHLNAPVVGIAVAPGQDGYWLVAADGGVFAFGDAPFAGSAA